MTSLQDTSETAVRAEPAAVLSYEVLKSRSDFVKAARGRKVVCESFILQVRNRKDDNAALRVGFTTSKKVGNAVARNRARRRLREVARAVIPHEGRPGFDYVLIGRAARTNSTSFHNMIAELRMALSKAHPK